MKKYAIITMDVEDWYHTYFPEANVDRSISLLDGLDVALDIMKKDDIHARSLLLVRLRISSQISSVRWTKKAMISQFTTANIFAL